MNRYSIITRLTPWRGGWQNLLRLTIFLIVVGVFAAACTHLRPLEPTAKVVKNNFTTGDMIKVYTRDETIITFEVVEITEEAIIGAREKIAFKDLLKIEKPQRKLVTIPDQNQVERLSSYGAVVVALFTGFFLAIF